MYDVVTSKKYTIVLYAIHWSQKGPSNILDKVNGKQLIFTETIKTKILHTRKITTSE